MTSLNTLWADRYGSPKNLQDLQDNIQQVITHAPHLYYFLMTQSMNSSLGIQGIKDQISLVQSHLLTKTQHLRGMKTDLTSAELDEDLKSAIADLNTLIDRFNSIVRRYKSNFESRAKHSISDSFIEEPREVTLSQVESNGDLLISNGPFSFTEQDYLSVGGTRLTFSSPMCVVTSSLPFTSGRIKGSLIIEALIDDVAVITEVEIGTYSTIDSELTVVDVVTIDEVVELLASELLGVAFVTKTSDNLIEIDGEPNVDFIRVRGSLSSIFRFPTKLKEANSGRFVPTQQLATTLGGFVKNTVVYSGEISVLQGVVSPTLTGTYVINSPYGKYVSIDGKLHPYATVTPVSSLSRFTGTITEEKITLLNIEGDVSSSISAVKDKLDNRFFVEGVIEERDILSKGFVGTTVTSKANGVVTTRDLILSGTYEAASREYINARSIYYSLMEVATSITLPVTYSDALEEIRKLDALLTDVANSEAAVSLHGEGGYTKDLSRAISKIRASHTNLGYDLAIEVLMEANFSSYFLLEENEGSYTSRLDAIAREIGKGIETL